jgi:hypothetical protein
MTIDELRTAVARMNVPPHKLDPAKPGVCKWLLDNLHLRNASHALYSETVKGLVAYATTQNWLKQKEIKFYLDRVENRAQVEPTVTGRISDHKPEFQELPRKAGTISILGSGRARSSMPAYSNIPRKP